MKLLRSFNYKKQLPYIFSVVVLSVFAYYIVENAERYQQLFDFSLVNVFSLSGIMIVFICVNGLVNFYFYRALNVFLSLNESIGLSAVNTLANQLPFAGGLLVKGVYLKQHHQLSFAHFLSATMALYVCTFSMNGFVALLVLTYWAIFKEITIPMILVLGFLGMAISVIVIWFPLDTIQFPLKVKKWFQQMAEGWQVLRQNIRLVVIMLGLQALLTLAYALRLEIAFRALSQDITYTQCLIFSSATILTRLVSIAPGGLGVREGLIAAIGTLLGFDPDVSIIAVGLDRLISTAVVILMGSYYSYILSKNILTD